MRKSHGLWYVRFEVDGKEYNYPTGLEATEQNREKVRQLQEIAKQRVLSGKAYQLRTRAIPFRDAATSFLEWIEGESKARSSYLRIKSSFSYAQFFFGREIVAAITPGRVDDFKAARRKLKVKEVSIRNDLHALSVFWQYAVRQNWARENVTEKVSIPSARDAVRINVLNSEQEALYFDTCLWMHKSAKFRTSPDQNSYRDLHDFGRLMLLQGCRPQEVVALRPADIDLDRGWLFIRSGKSRAARRRLKLTRETAEILASRLLQESPWIFPSPVSEGEHRGITWRLHSDVLDAMRGKPGECEFVPYDLRHNFATRAVLDGMPLPVLAAIMGHANLLTLEKYVHITEEHIDGEAWKGRKGAAQEVLDPRRGLRAV